MCIGVVLATCNFLFASLISLHYFDFNNVSFVCFHFSAASDNKDKNEAHADKNDSDCNDKSVKRHAKNVIFGFLDQFSLIFISCNDLSVNSVGFSVKLGSSDLITSVFSLGCTGEGFVVLFHEFSLGVLRCRESFSYLCVRDTC